MTQETIAGLLASGRTEGEIKVMGLISSMYPQVNRKTGNPWAIITMTDTGNPGVSVDVLFFPKEYSLYGGELTGNATVAVTGKLIERDGKVYIFARKLTRGMDYGHVPISERAEREYVRITAAISGCRTEWTDQDGNTHMCLLGGLTPHTHMCSCGTQDELSF